MCRLLYCWIVLISWSCLTANSTNAADVLLEAEAFENQGGWKLDTQFIQTMGSPYLLAHGLGQPVDDASTTFSVPEDGEYHVFTRTYDWVARWEASGAPGKFQVQIDGKALEPTFGTSGADWMWQPGGKVKLAAGEHKIALHDLTGFDGRCDAIYLSTDATPPSNDAEVMSSWRRERLGLTGDTIESRSYDLVVVGGGYAGTAAALSAARMGCKVALIQDRSVLGGNGSSEVRVWAMGLIRRGNYPRIGEIVEEFCDHATKSPGRAEEFVDDLKEEKVRAEKNIDLFLNHHAYAAETVEGIIKSVDAFDVRSGQIRRFSAPLFADCTGHGWLGEWANADYDVTPEGRMGMSNMWVWAEQEEPQTFPQTPWALQLSMQDFPYPRDHHGQWFWESGFDKNPIGGAEAIRDWNLRAVYGAFNAMKNGDGAERHPNATLAWVAYIGGPRESRRLMGDIVLTQDHVVEKHEFSDGCVPSTWSIDLHYPKEQYSKKFPENPFISYAVHDRRVDRSYGYPVPYRCFYSRNVSNLFMAGRNVSVTHEALGTVRVMKTCGMMGEVVGKAASICIDHTCRPRDVYESYWSEMDDLLKLPGVARRETVSSEMVIPDDVQPSAGPRGPMEGVNPNKLKGIVVDDEAAEKRGTWTVGTGLKGFIAHGYRYAGNDSNSSIRFTAAIPEDGKYDVIVLHCPHPNRGTTVPVTWSVDEAQQGTKRIDMQGETTAEHSESKVASLQLKKGQKVSVTLSTDGAGGTVHADAIRVVKQ
ncbi:tRNA uridine 5-carboxymethylaminomethyl modification enzyme GidA [Roseimaritima multifibrata]|uniref:tRNA uridine 5-carboxymethylaminomethyl modification enzyme GidA n=1 Tax=Roseimaritima multifibrata TaxID=1930274 RepID=A0A517MB51_9BACT|nr:FAD-dependent oxidoreductase [Roseimaritima multifibrata]QDS92017.1 tRNA uridine 5-carboxymethylaminomethyl modification enzyme GidA [Roseimaritima multifibrata]